MSASKKAAAAKQPPPSKAQVNAFGAFFGKRKAPDADDDSKTTAAAAAAPSADSKAAAASASEEPSAKQSRTAAKPTASAAPAAAAASSASPAPSPAKKKLTAGQRKKASDDNAAATATDEKKEAAEDAAASKEAAADGDAAMKDAAAAPASPSPSPVKAKPAASPAKPKPAPAAAAASVTVASPEPAKKPAAKAAAASSSNGSKKKRKVIADDEDEADEAAADEDADDAPKKKKQDDEEEEEEDEDAALLAVEELQDGDAAGSSLASPNYDPVKSASWKAGAQVPYSALTDLFDQVAECSGQGSRLQKLALISNFLRSVIALSPTQLVPIVYLCCNKIAPAYEGKETMVGDSILIKAVAEATGGTIAKLKAKFEADGDLGNVAMESRANQKTMFKPARLTCAQVFKTFRDLADVTGKSSAQKKADMIKKCLVACEGVEARFLIRALAGNLRINMAEKGVITALACAVTYTPPSLSGALPPPILDIRRTVKDKSKVAAMLERNLALINQAYTEIPNHAIVLDTVLKFGVEELPNKCFLQPGVPVKVMLGKPASSVDAILERFKDLLFTLEYKYDGERAQIHLLSDGRIMIYSRNSEDHTQKYPDLAKSLPHAFGPAPAAPKEDERMEEESKEGKAADASAPAAAAAASSAAASASSSAAAPVSSVVPESTISNFIIDCEVVAWHPVQKKILPFQTLSTRKKKGVATDEITVSVCLFAFDLLFLNGKSYINESLETRRNVLRANFHPVEGEFQFATNMDTSDTAHTAAPNSVGHCLLLSHSSRLFCAVSSDPDEITSFMAEATRNSCEGLMIKSLQVDASYIPNKRNWVKLKKDYMDGCGDSLDLVVIGAWKGKGKRSDVYGAYLMATYDEDTEEYQVSGTRTRTRAFFAV